jgi:hypothetical protein
MKKPKREARLMSRGELSRVRPQSEIDKVIEDREVFFGSKGFYGSPLPLIPDIRESEVSEGIVSTLLSAFGISKRFGRVVTLTQGPNKRLNRYLVHQYKRLIKSIDGTLTKGDKFKPAEIVWSYDFYRLSALDSGASAKYRKHLRAKARKYWCIANELLTKSIAFRIALINKTMGKAGRWFHRHFDLRDLFFINNEFRKIADTYSTKIKVKRSWISTEQRDKSYKWRPLGIAPYSWRLFTRGINNLLETFISASWPENQHGYKSGRGVHTAWNQILRTVINKAWIMDFDFTGFFNTVRIEAVGDVLHRLYVPKYMIAYLVTISSSEIENISLGQVLRNLKSKDPRKQGWAKAWEKYEFIHKYRKGYRSMGLPQGGALSPILSVTTLVVLDELEAIGIKYVIYADDGIFYADKKMDFLKEAQAVLDKYGIGAEFNLSKCHSIKEDGKWLSKLKFVGLEYDPFNDMLSAATRGGSTLKLKIGAIGLFSTTNIKEDLQSPIKRFWEENPSDWKIGNEKLFEYYEGIFMLKATQELKNWYFKDLRILIKLIMLRRLKRYTWEEICESEYGALLDFIYPMVLIKHLSGDDHHKLKIKYEKKLKENFPWELMLEIQLKYIWMHQTYLTVDEQNERYERKSLEIINDVSNGYAPKWIADLWNTTGLDDTISDKGAELVLEHLAWFKGQRTLPESLKNELKGDELELGEWYELALGDADIKDIPEYVARHIKAHGGKVGYTEVNWRNLYMDPAFATFIAKLFQNSFRSGVVKQDFRLTTDGETLNLVKMIDKYVGRRSFETAYNNGKFNIFNSSSWCSNLFSALLESWNTIPVTPKKWKVDPIKSSYKEIIGKITKRRSESDLFVKRFANQGKHFMYSPEEGGTRRMGKMKLSESDQHLIFCYPTISYIPYIKQNHVITKNHLEKKYENVTSLHIKAITRAQISTHELYTKMFKHPRTEKIYPYKSVKWDTLEPKKNLETRIKSENRVENFAMKADHPLFHTITNTKSSIKLFRTRKNWVLLKDVLKLKKREDYEKQLHLEEYRTLENFEFDPNDFIDIS